MLPGWIQELHGTGNGHRPETEEYGISSFIYSANRPFHPHRLDSLVKRGVTSWGVIRSKGLVWCGSDHEFAREWTQAGSSLALQQGRRWEDGPIDGRHSGDRRQELVFIGQNMMESEIRKALDDALLSDMEFATRPKVRNPGPRDESGEANTRAAKKARSHV